MVDGRSLATLRTGCADVARRVRRPGDAVDAGPVVAEPRHRRARHPHVQDHHLPYEQRTKQKKLGKTR